MVQVNLELQINLLENNLQFSPVETWNRYWYKEAIKTIYSYWGY